MRNQDSAGHFFKLQNLDHMAAHHLQPICFQIGRLVRIAIPQEIGGNNPIPGLLERHDLVSPVI